MNCHMQFLSSVIYNPYPELYTAPIQYHMQPFSSVIYSHIQCHTQPYLVIYIPYPVLYTSSIQYHTQPLSSVIPSPYPAALSNVIYSPIQYHVNRQPVNHQLYANDTLLYKSSCRNEVAVTIQSVQNCDSDINVLDDEQ